MLLKFIVVSELLDCRGMKGVDSKGVHQWKVVPYFAIIMPMV